MKEALQKLTVGVTGPIFGYAIASSTTELWLKIMSLLVGIIVGLLSAVSICFTIDRKYRDWKKRRTDKSESNYREETTTI